MIPQSCPFCQNELKQSSRDRSPPYTYYCNDVSCTSFLINNITIADHHRFMVWVTLPEEEIYLWAAIIKIDDVFYELSSRQKCINSLKRSNYTRLVKYNIPQIELELPQYHPLPENNIKKFLYNLAQQLVNLKSFI